MKQKLKRYLLRFSADGVNLVLISLITGIFAGLIITFYNIAAHYGEEYSVKLYLLIFKNPAFIPLLFLGLFSGAIVIGTLVKFVPMIRGSGIPQIEGVARGKIRIGWFKVTCTMFAASLACIFLGLAAGSEGPSLEMGGCIGNGVSRTLKRHQMIVRLQTAAGSSAGLAVAFNAPVTGLIFALEEAFRSFSPRVFLSAALSVVSALLVRNAVRHALGFSVGFTFENFSFSTFSLAECFWVIPAAIAVSLFGVLFYYIVFKTKVLFKKITFFYGVGKYIIPFLLAGAFGLISVYAMGGGHSFIDSLATHGTGEISGISVLGASIVISLVIITILRFISCVLYMGCGVPCGVFIPMLAIGAGLGAIASVTFQAMGMNSRLGDYLVIICMSVFFTTIVRAPITGIVMVFELTGEFTNFLPAILGIVVGYLISTAFKIEPIYERLLEEVINSEGVNSSLIKERVVVKINAYSKVDGARVRSVIWPSNGLIVKLVLPSGDEIVPDGETVLSAGSLIVFECETDSRSELVNYLCSLTGSKGEAQSED